VTYRRNEVAALSLVVVLASAWLGARVALAGRPAPFVPAPAASIDINDATEEELLSLPGVGPALARRFLDERDVRGPFASADDVARRVKGVGRSMLARWEGRAVVGQTSPRPKK
jgi:DNA uptake protein ComE-like DNA-binding protein